MRLLVSLVAVGLILAVAAPAGALTWDLSNPSDYYFSGSAGWNFGGWGSVAPWPDDEAAVLARVNTQAAALELNTITGGGYTINSFYTDSPGTPSLVYGSLYLSPTGGPGSTVMINMSPMSIAGSGGAYDYTFDLTTPADVKLRDGTGGAIWGPAHYTGTFGGAIGWVYGNGWGDDYAAFFGPQIGMSGTHNTQFNVTEINLGTVPEPLTMAGLMLGIGSLVTYVRKRRKA